METAKGWAPKLTLAAIATLVAIGILVARGTARADAVDESAPTPVSLGAKIFADPSLSASGRMACATCHDPGHAHAQSNDLSVQLGGAALDVAGTRAVPSLRYVSLIPAFSLGDDGPVGGFDRDGRADTLMVQAMRPLLSGNEMANASVEELIARLGVTPYADEFRQVYGADILARPDAAFQAVLFSLARYQKLDPDFRPFDSKYDYFLRGQVELTPAELRGLALFTRADKGNCAACHPSHRGPNGEPPMFTDFTYDNLGVPRNEEIPSNADPAYSDLGLCGPFREDLADQTDLCGAFKVPTLRNVATRHVFFHNGRFHTLHDALAFYVQRDTNPERFYPVAPDGTVDKFDDLPAALRGNVNTEEIPYDRQAGETPRLNDAELDDLEAFLGTLTDGYRPSGTPWRFTEPLPITIPRNPNMSRPSAGSPRRKAVTLLAPKRIALALGTALACAAPAAFADEAALRAEIAELRAQVSEMKAQMKELLGQSKTVAAAPAASAGAPSAGPPSTADLSARVAVLEQNVAAQPLAAPETTLFSYGEIAYSRPRNDSSETRADLARAVIGFGHRFDERTRAYGEFEWEHAIASADDQGEAEVEQLYVERAFTDRFGARVGLMLVPLGFLNESHEPPAYYGVFRNFVETAIIPTTWREGGIGLYGGTESGLHWNVGLTTGFDLSKWDATSDEGRESPLGSIHQELQLARARDLSIYAAANYQGVPGLTVGGGVFTGKAAQGAQNFAAPDARVTLWEGHARWQTGPFDLSALYARGTISDTAALNLTFVGDPTPVPKSFWGAYVQGAWHAWSKEDYSLTPFGRYERFNTAAAYEPVPQGLGVPPSPTEGVWTIGANFNVGPNIVLKADYQKFKVHTARDRFDLGFGYSF